MSRPGTASKRKDPFQTKKENTHSFQKGIAGNKGRTTNSDGAQSSDSLPFELQQLLLNIVGETFVSRADAGLPSLIQEIKQHLYKRDFANAFGREALLEAYVTRWSPSRALAYADILLARSELFAVLLDRSKKKETLPLPVSEPLHSGESLRGQGQLNVSELDSEPIQTLKIVCLGGGAGAEILAFAGFSSYLNGLPTGEGRSMNASSNASSFRFDITAVDIADWAPVIMKLYNGITEGPLSSQTAISKAAVSQGPLADRGMLNVHFHKYDVLDTEDSQREHLFRDCGLVTLMFTLNELYSTSMSATTNLLLSMTFLLEPGTLLLVVDSPGSYSTVSVGKTSENQEKPMQKKYPMQWLLDHTLLDAARVRTNQQGDGEKQWEKLEECTSKWFRLPPGLEYPIDLEDMRYQLHLYRRLS